MFLIYSITCVSRPGIVFESITIDNNKRYRTLLTMAPFHLTDQV